MVARVPTTAWPLLYAVTYERTLRFMLQVLDTRLLQLSSRLKRSVFVLCSQNRCKILGSDREARILEGAHPKRVGRHA